MITNIWNTASKFSFRICEQNVRIRRISSAVLSAHPKLSLMDEIVHIKVKNLRPEQSVIIKSNLSDHGTIFNAEGHYFADADGNVDCSKMESHGGSFIGCEPMGLMWGLKPQAGHLSGIRIRQKNVTIPHYINLSISNLDGEILSECTIEKHYKIDSVLRVPIRHGAIRGTLFIPNNGVGQYPSIVDLYGSTGGLPEYRAALLASRGYLVLALAYSQYEDLPKDLSVDFEYFEEAIDFLVSHKNAYGNQEVGIISISYGGVLAMDIARISKKVKAVVLIGAMFFRLEATKYRGEVFPYSSVPYSKWAFVENGEYEMKLSKVVHLSTPESIINLHEARHSSFLIIHGCDDQQGHAESAIHIAQNLAKNGHLDYSLFLYQGAGHLIEPPYIPFAYTSWHRVLRKVMVNGGNIAQHSHAQVDAWKTILNFFSNKLSQNN